MTGDPRAFAVIAALCTLAAVVAVHGPAVWAEIRREWTFRTHRFPYHPTKDQT